MLNAFVYQFIQYTVYFTACLLDTSVAKPIVFGFNKPVEPALGDFPFQASLVIKGKNGQSYFSFCGGSLIHPLWVLTAAHCIQLDSESPSMKPGQTFVALGSIYRNARGAQIIETVNLTIHPKYLSSGSINNDIGLIKLKKAPKLGKNVKVVQLHTEKTEDLLGNTAYLTGFGIVNDFYQEPERLRKATLKINTYKKCYNSPQFNSTQICGTSTVEQGKACKGDSGGPLTVLKSGKLVQVGITSRLALLPFCRIGFNHSVYTKVSAYIAWISKVTGINFMTYNKKEA